MYGNRTLVPQLDQLPALCAAVTAPRPSPLSRFFVQAAWPLVKWAMTTPHTPPAIGYTISCHVALPGTRVSRMCACRQPVAMRHSAYTVTQTRKTRCGQPLGSPITAER